jgi:rare lipoprotein A
MKTKGNSQFVVAVVTALLLCGSVSTWAASNPASSTSPKTPSTPAISTEIPKKSVETPKKSEVKRTAKAPKAIVGRASWYGKKFHGRQTASGEAYDMFQFTAAHKTLPLGTWLKVTNLRNGKWIIVRVNDRGPYVGDRVLDLSYGAAQMLNFRAKGVERVKAEVVDGTEVAVADQWAGLD